MDKELKKWKDMNVPEKIGTVIGYAIVVGLLIMALVAIISNDMSFADVVNWLFNFFGTIFGVILIAILVLIGIIIFFPGLIVGLIIGVIILIAFLIICALIAIF